MAKSVAFCGWNSVQNPSYTLQTDFAIDNTIVNSYLTITIDYSVVAYDYLPVANDIRKHIQLKCTTIP